MRKITKIALAMSVLTSALLADSTLGTQSTRLESMQLNNYMTKDGFNFFFNPAHIAGAQTGAFVELGLKSNGGAGTNNVTDDGAVTASATTTTTTTGTLNTNTVNTTATTTTDTSSANPNGMVGAIVNLGGSGSFGIVLNRANAVGNAFGLPAAARSNNIDLFYGLALESDLKIGARLTYASLENSRNTSDDDLRVLDTVSTYNQNNITEASTSNSQSASDVTIQLGVQTSGLDATLTYGMYDYSESATGANNPHDKTTTYGGLALADNITNITVRNDKESLDADGASLLEIALAYTMPLSKNSTLTSYGVYSSSDYSLSGSESYEASSINYDAAKNPTSETTLDEESKIAEGHTIDTIVLGASYNLKPVDNVLLVIAGEFTNTEDKRTYAEDKTKDVMIAKVFTAPASTTTTNGTLGDQTATPNNTVTTNDLSVVIAGEASVTDSLAIRFGLRESIYYDRENSNSRDTYGVTYTNNDAVAGTSNATSNTVKDTEDKDSNSNDYQPAMQLAVGFGYQASKEISIDGLINAELFLTGPNFISGQDISNLNARLALNYNF